MFLQERYGHFSMTDPFLALQRDFESGAGHKERRAVSANPITVLEAVMAHCRKMQERMSAQLAAAESRQKRVGLTVHMCELAMHVCTVLYMFMCSSVLCLGVLELFCPIVYMICIFGTFLVETYQTGSYRFSSNDNTDLV